jgi:hypothetical protein
LDEVLPFWVINLAQDHVCWFLVNPNLSLDDHVVNQSYKSTQICFVSLGQKIDSGLKELFFFHMDHRFVLSSLSDLSVVEIVLVGQRGWVVNSFN